MGTVSNFASEREEFDMSQGPQRFRKTEVGRIIDVANDKLGDAYNIVFRRDGTMVLQAGKKQEQPPDNDNESGVVL
jgi:hypothetical protein